MSFFSADSATFAFSVTFILYSMLVLDARKMAIPIPSKDDTCIDDISLGQLTTNTSFTFLAKRTSAQSEESQTSTTSKTGEKAIPVGSLNLCSMIFVLPRWPSRLKMITVLFAQWVIQTCFLFIKGCSKRWTDIYEYWARGFSAWQLKSTNSKAITNEKTLGLFSNEDDFCRVLKRLRDNLDCSWISYVFFVNKILFTID